MPLKKDKYTLVPKLIRIDFYRFGFITCPINKDFKINLQKKEIKMEFF